MYFYISVLFFWILSSDLYFSLLVLSFAVCNLLLKLSIELEVLDCSCYFYKFIGYIFKSPWTVFIIPSKGNFKLVFYFFEHRKNSCLGLCLLIHSYIWSLWGSVSIISYFFWFLIMVSCFLGALLFLCNGHCSFKKIKLKYCWHIVLY